VLVVSCDCCLGFCVVTWLPLIWCFTNTSQVIDRWSDWLGRSSPKWPIMCRLRR